jgi:PadR family transcriptional regulator PadR
MITEMREPTFLVLASLAEGRKHGYGIIKDATTLSDGRVRLRVGTLYTALDRLEAEGLVARAGDEVVDGRNRRYYELTDAGATELGAEIDRQRAKVAHAAVRLSRRAASTTVAR